MKYVASHKFQVQSGLRALTWHVRTLSKDWVWGRVACMGKDVYALLDTQLPLFNVQKGRIDYILDAISDRRLKARPQEVAKCMARKDVLPLIAQQGDLTWLRMRPPIAVYMDSFSELTDQLFVHRQKKWQFCCNYSDLQHTERFVSQFEQRGLLPVLDLPTYYRNFLSITRERWGDIPIIYLHFPVKLEKREKFRVRYQYILEAITQMAEEFQPFHSLTVNDEFVDWPEERAPGLEDFPYHYHQRTYQLLAEQVKTTGVFYPRE